MRWFERAIKIDLKCVGNYETKWFKCILKTIFKFNYEILIINIYNSIYN